MKRLQIADNDILTAERIVREDNRISGYSDTGEVIFTFEGINDFDQFHLLDEAQWDQKETDPNEEIAQLKSVVKELEDMMVFLTMPMF